MRLDRRMKIQLALFTVIALMAMGVMGVHFMKLPAKLFGVGRYTVTVQLPQAGGLYSGGNVTYRGTEVGRVEAVRLTPGGVDAVLSLKSGIDVPSDLRAEVHSQSAIGEQYVALLPRSGDARPLRDGDVITPADTSVPPNVNTLLADANVGLQAIPRDNLQTVVEESYAAVGGLGPELSRIVDSSTKLAIEARRHLDPLITLIDQSQPVLDSQTRTSEAIQAWAAQVATVTTQLQTQDQTLARVIDDGGESADAVRQLVDRVKPTLPIVLANLVSVGQVAVTYHDNIEQLLVLFPAVVSAEQAGLVANLHTKQDYKGQYLSFNLNINLPPPCTTGFLPAQQQRSPVFEDAPERPPGDLYCRVPQDSPLNVRGAHNIPCATRPGKRAPTVAICESDEIYVPLNDGFNWKGDPNATSSGQPVPQLPPAAGPQVAPPALAAAEYDPATGSYIGPDGRSYTQADLAQGAPAGQTWQTMLLPPGS
ncbi:MULTISPECIES: MCE family protein [Mycolicibacterium]|jgi:phospholipid/cholesterol/gamma-HCH transport system substrate-binding protein|uniref:MlaD family protein n=1 Tax=Mycolicibacterium austroafricanum TaxID=39687 RepID=A0ABT8HJ93_MYCAO|nr:MULTISPECIES: MlaD family protein [Mycolicibacterium]MDN4520838.1 MlaD family protein [Mycolicibacterium austroafricanum]PQP50328.1 mammalian cell entry protein [Mycolicibacterium austroafricanum]QRZ04642.1 MCE family protein [Mycolicibacterium austroafricanum]QZT66689.1 MCE family protein [Mycolicibacterium austroafricanum]